MVIYLYKGLRGVFVRKFISLILSAVMLISVIAGVNLSACAETTYTYTSSTGSFNYIVLDNGTIEIERVIMNNGVALESLVIPSSINGKTVTVSSYKTTSKTVKSLKAKKKYYVRVRTYKTVSGTKYYSSWSKAKSVTTKK